MNTQQRRLETMGVTTIQEQRQPVIKQATCLAIVDPSIAAIGDVQKCAAIVDARVPSAREDTEPSRDVILVALRPRIRRPRTVA
jgi:hypothetical protein